MRGWNNVLRAVGVVSVAAAFGLCQSRAQEQERVLRLDPVVVSARGHATPVSETPGGIGVITREQIGVRVPASLSNLMELVPAVAKGSDSPWGSDISIRGLGRDAVTLLIDGCRVETANNISAQYGLIDPAVIERIEVLKGPISSLYGSGSTGGVVNVITRTGRFLDQPEWHGGLSLSGMSNPKGVHSSVDATYGSPHWYVYLGQGFRDHAAFEDGEHEEMRNSQFRDYQTTLKLGHRLNDMHTFELRMQFLEGKDLGVPGSGTSPMPATADLTVPRMDRELYSFTYTYSPDGPRLEESKLTLFYQPIARRIYMDHFPAVGGMVPADIFVAADYRNPGLKWQNRLTFGDHTVVAGLDLWQKSMTTSRIRAFQNGIVLNDEPVPKSEFNSMGVFAEDTWVVSERLTLNVGGRVDEIAVESESNTYWDATDEEVTSWNAHAGATVSLTDKLSLKVLAAHGYRAASLEERYAFIQFATGVTKWGDPELTPEESDFGEVGLHWVGDSFAGSVSAFYNRLDDLIADKVVDPTTIRVSNVKEGEILGCEAEARWFPWHDWEAYANAAYICGDDVLEDEYLPSIAPVSGLAGLRYGTDSGLWGFLEMNFAARQDHTPPGVDEVAGWQTVRVRVGYDFAGSGSQHQVFCGVDNLSNESYNEYLTTSRGFQFNEPGRSFVVGYQGRF